MIHLDEKTLRQVQLIQLEMLMEVDRICRKCNIKYNIIAGTLLGAVRHGGFIPWDDDADVALLRPEYEKFREACKTELDTTRFYFQDHRSTEGYRWGYGKLRRKNTLFLREHQEHMPYEQGIFIDIFPLDGVPDNYLFRCIHNLQCTIIRKVLWSAVGRKADKNVIMRRLYGHLYKIPTSIVFNCYHKLIDKSNRKKTKMVRILMFPTPNKKYGYYRKWYEESSNIKFENHYFKGIREYNEYLTFKFGDYMTLPEENQRKVHPVSDIKLLDNQ
jgi:lipopolysaccharide cholinephosphotransferase